MINERSIRAVSDARLHDSFAVPLYDTYCFSQIPQTVFHALTGEGAPGLPADVWGELPQRYDKVIVILIDGLGWHFLERFADMPVLQRFFGDRGCASRLTSQFPSTTSAHIPTIHTGLNVGQTGIHEWYMYDPIVDDIIIPLLFSYARDKGRDTLLNAKFKPEQLFPFRTLYQNNAQHGIKSVGVQSHLYTPSSFDRALCTGADMQKYFTLTDGLLTLRDAVLNTPGKGYFYFYYEGVDTTSHHRAPFSDHFNAEVEALLYLLETYLMRALDGQSPNTCVLLTADHGQIATDHTNIPMLHQMKPNIEPFLKRNRAGKILTPAGSGRDLFLHIQPQYIEEAEALLRRQLAPDFSIYRVPDLIDQGVFADASPRLRERVGDLLVLANTDQFRAV